MELIDWFLVAHDAYLETSAEIYQSKCAVNSHTFIKELVNAISLGCTEHITEGLKHLSSGFPVFLLCELL